MGKAKLVTLFFGLLLLQAKSMAFCHTDETHQLKSKHFIKMRASSAQEHKFRIVGALQKSTAAIELAYTEDSPQLDESEGEGQIEQLWHKAKCFLMTDYKGEERESVKNIRTAYITVDSEVEKKLLYALLNQKNNYTININDLVADGSLRPYHISRLSITYPSNQGSLLGQEVSQGPKFQKELARFYAVIDDAFAHRTMLAAKFNQTSFLNVKELPELDRVVSEDVLSFINSLEGPMGQKVREKLQMPEDRFERVQLQDTHRIAYGYLYLLSLKNIQVDSYFLRKPKKPRVYRASDFKTTSHTR